MEAWQSLEDNLQKEAARKSQVGFLSQNLSKLVLSYMIHHGYSESARQFASDLAPQSSNQKGHGTHGSNEFDCASMVQDTERRKGTLSHRSMELHASTSWQRASAHSFLDNFV